MPRSDREEGLLTVVIPVFNREDLILRCLDSIASRTLSPVRVIVVDNNSTDATRDAVVRWGEAHDHLSNVKLTLLSEMRPGAAAARNRGLSEVTTPWVMFFDSDDLMMPGHIDSVVKGIGENPDADILFWPIRIHLTEGSVRVSRDMGVDPLESQMIHCSFATLNYAVRTDFIRKAGGWDSSLRAWDDWELGMRLLLGSPRIARVVTPGVDVMRQPDSITGLDFSSKQGRWEEAIDRIESDIRGGGISGKEKALLLKACSYRRMILAADYIKEDNKEGAEALEERVRKDTDSCFLRLLLKGAERYTAAGGRGAWRILRFFRLIRS